MNIIVKSRAYVEYFKQGLIIGNNANLDYGISREADDKKGKNKFDGALVGDPKLNSFTGIDMFKMPSKFIFDNCVDFDFSSLYPSIIIGFNIAPNTMIGKLIIGKSILDTTNDIMGDLTTIIAHEDDEGDEEFEELKDETDEKYDAGKFFVDNFLVCSPIQFGTEWFNLPTVEEMIIMVKDELFNPKTKVINIKDDTKFIEPLKIQINI